jgi:hypothetical protein
MEREEDSPVNNLQKAIGKGREFIKRIEMRKLGYKTWNVIIGRMTHQKSSVYPLFGINLCGNKPGGISV